MPTNLANVSQALFEDFSKKILFRLIGFISKGLTRVLPSEFRMATVLFDLETSIPTAIIEIPPLTVVFDWIQPFKIHSYSLVKRELCPNLLNRMQNNEGWLTHLLSGVMSQLDIS